MPGLTLSGGLALDLGASHTLIYRKGGGVMLNEPSLAALDTRSGRVLAVGREAEEYLGRTPRNLAVIRPVEGGLIRDPAAAGEMLRLFLRQAGAGRGFFRPQVLMAAPLGLTPPEKNALLGVLEQAGAKSVRLVGRPLAAALGLGLDLDDPSPRLVLDIGAAAAEGALLTLGAVAFAEARREAGGDEATQALIRLLRRECSLEVGESTAELLKAAFGSDDSDNSDGSEAEAAACRGRDTLSGLPREINLARADIEAALAEAAGEVVLLVRRLLSQAPPEWEEALGRDGIILTGGGSLLPGLTRRLTQATGLIVQRPENPFLSVVLGLGEVLADLAYYKNILLG